MRGATSATRTRSWVFTETGYNDSRQSSKGVTIRREAVATYVTRGIADYFKRRVVDGRFELLDDPDAVDYSTQIRINQSSDRDAHFGLITMTKHNVRAG